MEEVRYRGLPLGTQLYAKNLHIPSFTTKKGTVTVCTRLFKRFSNGEFFADSQEFEEWYLRNITERNDKYKYNELSDEFIIGQDVYRFYGYAFGCEFLISNGKGGIYKTLMRISWDNIRLYTLPMESERVNG